MEDSESIFSALQPKEIDEVFPKFFKMKTIKSPDVIDLIIGMYRTNEGNPHFFNTTKKVERELYQDPTATKEYCTLTGLPDFIKCSQELVFGKQRMKMISAQSLSGTGAIGMSVHLLKKLNFTKVWINDPCWPGHPRMVRAHGLTPEFYPYYSDFEFKYEEMIEFFKQLQKGSAVIMQGGEHNPTGYDFSKEQWEEVAQVIKERSLFPVVDFAYQGFGSGDVDEDAWGVRHLYDQGIEMIVCQSYSKNFSYYNQRIGAVHVVVKTEKVLPLIKGQLQDYSRSLTNQPPMHGARVVTRILSDPELRKEWKEQVKEIAKNIIERRHKLREAIEALDVPGDWSCITKQIGMFALLPITPKQVEQLEQKLMFMLSNGRISMGCIPVAKIPIIAERLASVLKS